MAAVGHTRQQLREEVARVFGLLEGTATGGTTGTVVDSSLTRYADDYFINASAYIKTDAGGANAAPECQERMVTDFASATGTLTVLPVYTAAPASSDTYQIYQRVTVAEINAALTRVCRGALGVVALTPSGSTLDYDLSGTTTLMEARQIVRVMRRELNDNDTQPYPVPFQVKDTSGVLTLTLPILMNTTDGLWVEYESREDIFTTAATAAADAVKITVPVELIRCRATVYLLENRLAQQTGQAFERAGQELRYWRERLLVEERRHHPNTGRARRHPWEQGMARVSRGEEALGLSPNYGGSFADYP